MFTIHLCNLKFIAFHGVHDEERILGGEYEINAAITFTQALPILTLQQTIDYVKIYGVIKQRMDMPTPLLETIVQDLTTQIQAIDNRITAIEINLKKLHPPIAAFTGSVAINYKKEFTQ